MVSGQTDAALPDNTVMLTLDGATARRPVELPLCKLAVWLQMGFCST
jgi:hypothetical protein